MTAVTDQGIVPVPGGRRHVGPISRLFVWRRLSTPTHLRIMLVTAVVLTVALGSFSAVAFGQAHLAATTIAREAGPSLVDTAKVHTALSEADRVAARNFLSGGAVRLGGAGQEYQDNIKNASVQLSRVAERNVAGAAGSEQIQAVEALLVLYTGLIGQSHANAGNGALGAAYLTYASNLMHRPGSGILARVDTLEDLQRDALTTTGSVAWLRGRAVLFDLVFGAVVVTMLVAVQWYLSRGFRRLLNPALVAAAVVLALLTVTTCTRKAQVNQQVGDRALPTLAALNGIWTAQAVLADTHAARVRALIGSGEFATTSFEENARRLVDRPLTRDDLEAATAGDIRFGGMLADALRSAAPGAQRAAVVQAVRAFQNFLDIDREVRLGDEAGRADEADLRALGRGGGQLGGAFDATREALDDAAAVGQRHFETAIIAATDHDVARGAIPLGTSLAVILVLVGMAPRMKEYR